MSRERLLIVIAVALLALVGVVVGASLLLTGGDPESVQEVADRAVDAAEDLDVDEGIDLLCEAPSTEDREGLDDLISEAQDRAGTDDPEVDYEISDVEGDRSGSFTVTVSSDEEGLEDEDFSVVVLVETDGDRSCIAGAEDAD